MKLFSILLLALFSSVGIADSPDDLSVYQLDIHLETHAGKTIPFESFKDEPLLIGMFYASCPHACPLTIHNIQKAENTLSSNLRKKFRVLMVSLDPDRDTPAMLKEVVERQHINTERWTLARIPQADVRKLAAVLGVRYRQLDDGEINHTSQVSLIDSTGKVIQQSDALSSIEETFMKAVVTQLK